MSSIKPTVVIIAMELNTKRKKNIDVIDPMVPPGHCQHSRLMHDKFT
jgi:hypothetical protein